MHDHTPHTGAASSATNRTAPTSHEIIVDCLCGKPHPCPDHGQWAHTSYRPIPPRAQRRPLNGFYLLRLLDEAADTIGHHHKEEAG